MTDKNREGVTPGILQTDIMTVSANTQITETNEFQAVLSKIPGYVGQANQLLADYRKDPSTFVAEIDEDQLDEDLKEINSIVRFSNEISKGRQDMRRYFNGIRDEATAVFDKRLEDAQFDDLKEAHNDIKQLKKDMTSQRMSDRWKELEPIFTGSIQHYPIIAELAPELLDFSKFRLIHSKLVSGAKSRPLTDTIRREVTQIINEWDTALNLIKDNQWGLDPTRQLALLNVFKSEPSVGLVNEQGPLFKQQMDAEIERKRQEDARRVEQQKQAEKAAEERKIREEALRKQQEAAKKAQSENERKLAEERTKKLQEEARIAQEHEAKRKAELEEIINKQVSPQARQSFPNVVEYIFSEPMFKDLHSSTQSKAAAVYDISQQLTIPDSPMMKDTNGDASLYLEAIRFILDA